MNAQQIFDKVVTHLHTQGKQSRLDSGDCAYRSESGLKCAVGCLITDSNYRKAMDPASIDAVLDSFTHLPRFLYSNSGLLSVLQAAHDDCENWTTGQRSFTCNLKRDLQAIARRYALSTTTLNALETY